MFLLKKKYIAYQPFHIYVAGFCTEYNVYGAVIQPHYHLKCDIVDPPCANRYISTDAYLCKFTF